MSHEVTKVTLPIFEFGESGISDLIRVARSDSQSTEVWFCCLLLPFPIAVGAHIIAGDEITW